MKKFNGRTPYIILITLIVIFSGLYIALNNPGSIKSVRNIVFDSYQRIKPRINENSAVVILDIDETSIQKLGQWPWPRNVMAELLLTAKNAGAMAIGYDMVFSEKDRTSPKSILKNLPETIKNSELLSTVFSTLKDNDDLFAAQIKNAPVALGFFDASGQNTKLAESKAGFVLLGADISGNLHQLHGSIASLTPFQKNAKGQGFISVSQSDDDVVRTIPLFAAQEGNIYPALSIETLRVAIGYASGEAQSFALKSTYSGSEGGNIQAGSGGAAHVTAARVANFQFPLTRFGEFNIYYSKNDPEQSLSAYQLLELPADAIRQKLEGKIVLVGASAAGLRDIRNTPLREAVPGVAIHGQIIDQIMQGEFLNRPDWALGAELTLTILLTLAIVLVLPLIGAIAAALFGALCAGIIVATSWFAFDWYGLLVDPAVPLLVSMSAYGMTTILLFAFSEKEKRFVRSAFKHYLAPDLLARLEENPEALKLGGEIKTMTLMFLDIRGFTPISEKLDPQQLVRFLNQLLSPLSDIIQTHEGAIDKYIGDSIMAFWNAPLDVADHPKKACMAALEMLDKLDKMNKADAFGFKSRGLGDVRIGIGINTGDGCVGNIGSVSRFDYSVVGDTVNIAARLESASKDAGWPILISSTTADANSDLAILSAGRLELKGKSEPQEVYALLGDEDYRVSKEFETIKSNFEKLLMAPKSNKNAILKTSVNKVPARLYEFFSKRV